MLISSDLNIENGLIEFKEIDDTVVLDKIKVAENLDALDYNFPNMIIKGAYEQTYPFEMSEPTGRIVFCSSGSVYVKKPHGWVKTFNLEHEKIEIDEYEPAKEYVAGEVFSYKGLNFNVTGNGVIGNPIDVKNSVSVDNEWSITDMTSRVMGDKYRLRFTSNNLTRTINTLSDSNTVLVDFLHTNGNTYAASIAGKVIEILENNLVLDEEIVVSGVGSFTLDENFVVLLMLDGSFRRYRICEWNNYERMPISYAGSFPADISVALGCIVLFSNNALIIYSYPHTDEYIINSVALVAKSAIALEDGRVYYIDSDNSIHRTTPLIGKDTSYVFSDSYIFKNDDCESEYVNGIAYESTPDKAVEKYSSKYEVDKIVAYSDDIVYGTNGSTIKKILPSTGDKFSIYNAIDIQSEDIGAISDIGIINGELYYSDLNSKAITRVDLDTLDQVDATNFDGRVSGSYIKAFNQSVAGDIAIITDDNKVHVFENKNSAIATAVWQITGDIDSIAHTDANGAMISFYGNDNNIYRVEYDAGTISGEAMILSSERVSLSSSGSELVTLGNKYMKRYKAYIKSSRV